MRGRVVAVRMARARWGAALIVDGRVDDLVLDDTGDESLVVPHVVYRAQVSRVLPKGAGAFLDLGAGRSGYLRDAAGVREGERLLVQASGFAEPGKAPPVTRHLLLKGLVSILTPGRPGVNVSRSIRGEEERARLTEAAEAEMARAAEAGKVGPEDGVIVRTAAATAEATWVAADIGQRAELWEEICENLRRRDGLGPMGGLVPSQAVLSEWWQPPPHAVEIMSDDSQNQDFVGEIVSGPASVDLRHLSHEDPFDLHGVWDEIDRLKRPDVSLPGGGSMLVEAGRTLVAVDVNTGGDFSPAAGLKANLEAAKELPRQLRLRGLGGQVVVDFAPIPKKDRRRLEEALKAAFRRDPVETTLHGWTTMGFFEIQRKRARRSLAELLLRP